VSGRGLQPRRLWWRPRPPHLPAGFRRTFSSRFIDAGEVRLHAVIGGEGPPLLLVHGWPENWYAWHRVMPALAPDFEVFAVDQRGMGRSDKPAGGYDTGTLAGDLVALMDALGHERFAVVGHDTGHFISYALAADHPERSSAWPSSRSPGPRGRLPHRPCSSRSRSTRSGTSPSTGSTRCPNSSSGDRKTYFGYEFAIQAGKKVPREVVRYYVRLVSNPKSLRGSLSFYRAWDATVAQNAQRGSRPLTTPVLAIGGAAS
jgi:pimeloyl-ACP methyl ester carboxylesterase